MVYLPLPGVQNQVEGWLERDWATGAHNVNQILAYTLQFIPAVGAVNAALARLPDNELLAQVAVLADQPFDWDLLRFDSASLENRLWWLATFGISRSRYPIELRLDTPARAAYAGFWHWHKKESTQAAEAFAVTRNLRHGPELHGIAQAIVAGQEVGYLSRLVVWEQATAWLQALPDPELRPDTLATLRILRTVAGEARVARESLSPLYRSAALGRANAALTRLIDTVDEICPYPEWPFIREIATKWRDIVSLAGGVVGDEVLRQPVPNPYEGYSGLPVTGHAFRGREAMIRQIETLWSTSEQLPPIILYGHRRMGKSSILRNLAARAEPGTILVYLDMQDLTLADHTGQLLLDIAEAIQRAAAAAGLDAGSAPNEDDYASLGAARRALNALLARLAPALGDGGRLILAVDEFELIEDGIRQERLDPGLLGYLRAVNQRHRWLGLIFAGLHTLDEMGRDYRSAFHAQAEHLRVGYLSYADAERLVTQPHPDFALEYSPQLRQELYTLTYGQPYLLQRLCWELVNAWNERFLAQGESTPRTLTLEDLAPVLTPDFYHGAGYYFDGVWSNVTDGERELMRLIASRPAHAWSPDELAAASDLSLESVHVALELLRRHDVILPDSIRFASELLRRWVEHAQVGA